MNFFSDKMNIFTKNADKYYCSKEEKMLFQSTERIESHC